MIIIYIERGKLFSWFVSFFIIFTFFISTKCKNQKGHALLWLGASGIEKLFSEVALQTRDPPYFSLRLSILAGTNLIMLLLLFYFCNPRLIPKKIHPPFDFRENSSSFDFRENPCKTPKENQKNCFFFFCSLCFLFAKPPC